VRALRPDLSSLDRLGAGAVTLGSGRLDGTLIGVLPSAGADAVRGGVTALVRVAALSERGTACGAGVDRAATFSGRAAP